MKTTGQLTNKHISILRYLTKYLCELREKGVGIDVEIEINNVGVVPGPPDDTLAEVETLRDTGARNINVQIRIPPHEHLIKTITMKKPQKTTTVKNPRTGRYVTIDKEKGKIVKPSKKPPKK